MKTLQVAISRGFGKNHAKEQMEALARGMAIFSSTIDEVTPPKILIPKAKTYAPKRMRIPDKEPYYVKLTKMRRR